MPRQIDVGGACRSNRLEDGLRALPAGLLRYIMTTSWKHQLPLLAFTIVLFLIEVVPLEMQRRVVNDVVKHRNFRTILLLGAAYVGAVLVQGAIKLGLNLYRGWVGERAKRDLRRRICGSTSLPVGLSTPAEAQGTAVSLIVAEVEPVGGFIGMSISEPLLQAGVLVTVIAYIVHLDRWMGLAALVLFVPQLVFIPLMQHAMNRQTRSRIWLLRQIGAGIIVAGGNGQQHRDPRDGARIDRVFRLNMRIFRLKFTMNFLMNLCSHLQVVVALLLGGWWVLQNQLEIGGVVAFISGIGRLNDPWGDLVNYFREASATWVKYRLIAAAMNTAEPADRAIPAPGMVASG